MANGPRDSSERRGEKDIHLSLRVASTTTGGGAGGGPALRRSRCLVDIEPCSLDIAGPDGIPRERIVESHRTRLQLTKKRGEGGGLIDPTGFVPSGTPPSLPSSSGRDPRSRVPRGKGTTRRWACHPRRGGAWLRRAEDPCCCSVMCVLPDRVPFLPKVLLENALPLATWT